MPADRRPGSRPDDEREEHVRGSGSCPSNDEPIQTARIAPDEVLALAADVEEAAAEGERDREPDEDQRRRRDQRLLQVERGEDGAPVPVTHGKNQLRPEPSKIAW